MSKFNVYDAILNWQNSDIYIPEYNKNKIHTLIEGMVEDAVKKYYKDFIIYEKLDNIYWNSAVNNYVEIDDIIEDSIFLMWEDNWYPKRSKVLTTLLEGQEIDNFYSNLHPLLESTIKKIKFKFL